MPSNAQKRLYLGVVWIVSGWCLRVSGRCLVVYSCHINWKQLNKTHKHCIAFSSSAPQCAKMPTSGGVWMVSGWGLWVSVRCLGVYRCHINWKQLNKSRSIMHGLYFQCPPMRKNTYIWGCLDSVWGCRDGVWMGSMGLWEMSGAVCRCHIDWKQLNKCHNIKLLLFFPVPSNAQKRLYLGVSG